MSAILWYFDSIFPLSVWMELFTRTTQTQLETVMKLKGCLLQSDGGQGGQGGRETQTVTLYMSELGIYF